MHPSEPATELRRRARHLRELATTIEQLSILRLDRHAGDDTWHGPRAALCRSVLSSNHHQLYAAADHLRSTAIRFDLQAAALEAAEVVTAPLPGGLRKPSA